MPVLAIELQAIETLTLNSPTFRPRNQGAGRESKGKSVIFWIMEKRLAKWCFERYESEKGDRHTKVCGSRPTATSFTSKGWLSRGTRVGVTSRT